jgi:hypothetical protein
MSSGTREALEYRERRNRASFYQVLGAVGEIGGDMGLWYRYVMKGMQQCICKIEWRNSGFQ